jgi:hypothetical protein
MRTSLREPEANRSVFLQDFALDPTSIAVLVVQVILLFLASTVVFDIVHYVLHVFSDSRFVLLRRIGNLHAAHHAFLDRDLEINDEFLRANIFRHVIPEFLTQASFSVALLWILPPVPVFAVLAIQLLVFLGILACRGKDVNHKPISILRAYRPTFFCLPPYHALHHVSPDAHFSSWIKLFDHVAGKGVSFEGRRVAITGAASPFGAALRELLERHGVKEIAALEPGRDFDLPDVSRLGPVLRDADILILAHGGTRETAMAANCDSFVAAIELFKETARDRKLPIEVWALGSEREWLAPPRSAGAREAARAKRAFARQARRFYVDDRVIYRHIVPARIHARPGKGILTASLAARIAFFFIRRGFNYVPVTLNGIALLYFVGFRFFVRPAPAAAG